jgi:hypothetical protein
VRIAGLPKSREKNINRILLTTVGKGNPVFYFLERKKDFKSELIWAGEVRPAWEGGER